VPQALPAPVQLELELLLNKKVLPAESLEAKVEIFLTMFWLWQAGQVTSLILPVLSTSCSNGLPDSAHTNSKMGIFYSGDKISRY
jgi:hypothetical protein